MQFPNSIKNLACEISRLRRVASATQFYSAAVQKKSGVIRLGSHRLFYFRCIYQTKNLSASTAAIFYIPLSGKQGLKEICDCLKRTDEEITDRR